MMRTENNELWLAFYTMAGIGLFYSYIVISTGTIPAASELFGHSLGIIGFLLMVMTETLYSLRKRSRVARWGRMSVWLKFHIYTGLVGPFLVLLHTSWKYNGLAGIVLLLTIIIVFSGFVGRYIYTAVPRTADGVLLERAVLESQIVANEQKLKTWLSRQPGEIRQVGMRLATIPASQNNILSVIGRYFFEIDLRLRFYQEEQHVRAEYKQQIQQLGVLIKQKQKLRAQINGLAQARRLLSLWHAIHVPLGITLFSTALIHITAAIYYATILH
jgi:hypothetical protein